MQEDPEGRPYVRLELPYYRAWASVERALGESSFQVRDRDRSNGLFFIRFVEKDDDDDGWFGWLAGGDDDEALAEITDQDFQLKLAQEADDLVYITISREDQAGLENGQALNLLSLIKGNIN